MLFDPKPSSSVTLKILNANKTFIQYKYHFVNPLTKEGSIYSESLKVHLTIQHTWPSFKSQNWNILNLIILSRVISLNSSSYRCSLPISRTVWKGWKLWEYMSIVHVNQHYNFLSKKKPNYFYWADLNVAKASLN